MSLEGTIDRLLRITLNLLLFTVSTITLPNHQHLQDPTVRHAPQHQPLVAAVNTFHRETS